MNSPMARKKKFVPKMNDIRQSDYFESRSTEKFIKRWEKLFDSECRKPLSAKNSVRMWTSESSVNGKIHKKNVIC